MQPKHPEETHSHTWKWFLTYFACVSFPFFKLRWEPWPSWVNCFAFHLFLKAFNKRQILHIFYIVAYNYSALYKYSPSLNLSTFHRCYNLEINRTQYSSQHYSQRKMLTRLLHRLLPCHCCETLNVSSGVSSCLHKMTELVKWCHHKCNSEVI